MKNLVLFGLAMTLAGCGGGPVDYQASLSMQDSKWGTRECQQARVDAADYREREKKNLGTASSVLLAGPYGVALAASIRDNERKQRRKYAREVHLNCSSKPLPRELQPEISGLAKQKFR